MGIEIGENNCNIYDRYGYRYENMIEIGENNMN